MRKNKKGFTLVELLAVIVILAIIMIIATQSVGKTVTRSRTQAFNETMELAVKNAKRILQTDGTLTEKALKDSLGYDKNEYDFQVIPSQTNDGYLVILTSTTTGKFKNVDFTRITQNPDWIYKKGAGNESGKNIISFKIDSAGDLSKIVADSDDEKIAKNELKNMCTVVTEENKYDPNKSPEENIGKMISFCNNDVIYKLDEALVKGKSEDFYVISDNGDTVTALAKNSLYISKSNIFFGKQAHSSNERNYLEFTQIKQYNYPYWSSFSESPKRKYGDKYDVYVFDENSSLYEYIKEYENYLTGVLNKNLFDIRLIKKEELNTLGCIKYHNGDKYLRCDTALGYDWVYSTSYWTGTAKDKEMLYYVYSVAKIVGAASYNNKSAGIRPVITISKSDI